MKHTLEVDSIILEFGSKRVLQDVYLQNETGKITGVLGRNGAGKSCLLKIIFGELETNNKSVRFNGEAIHHGFRKPDRIRYLPQFNFIPGPLRVGRIFKDFHLDFSEFTGYFPDFGKYYKQRINRLSGGERRIIEIYSILASDTQFCMLDEPFSHVMPVHIEAIKKVFQKEKQKKRDHHHRPFIRTYTQYVRESVRHCQWKDLSGQKQGRSCHIGIHFHR